MPAASWRKIKSTPIRAPACVGLLSDQRVGVDGDARMAWGLGAWGDFLSAIRVGCRLRHAPRKDRTSDFAVPLERLTLRRRSSRAPNCATSSAAALKSQRAKFLIQRSVAKVALPKVKWRKHV